MVSSSARQAIAGILLIFAVTAAAHSQTTPPKEPSATLSGKVTIKGQGAPGIVVGLRMNQQQDTNNYRGVTDADGEYRITNIRPGSYQVIPSAPAYVYSEAYNARTLLINKGETIEHVDFKLVPGGAITGKVVDEDGHPLIEEEVSIIPVARNSTFSNMGFARTDDRGIYRAFGLAAGSYRVAAGREDEGFNTRGRNSYKRIYYPGVADPAQATAVEVTEGSEAANIDITLTHPMTGFTASGRVVDAETGAPIADVNFGITYFSSPNSTSSWSPGTRTTARGEFTFDKLQPGKYSISLRPTLGSEWRVDSVRFEIIDQDVNDLVIKARKGASISGVVVMEGDVDKTVRLGELHLGASSADDNEGRMYGYWANVAPDGSFRVPGLPGGLVRLYLPSSPLLRVVRMEHDGIVSSHGVELKEGQQLTGVRLVVTVANASIRGAIELENGTLPANGRFFANLRKIDEDPKTYGLFDHSFYETGTVDARGRFVIPNLLQGTYELEAGVYLPGTQAGLIKKNQQIVVTAGMASNVTVTIDLNSAPAKP